MDQRPTQLCRRVGTCIAVALVAAPLTSRAQTAPVSFPRGFVLPNYDTVLVGQVQGLEGGAFIARADDASASYYNPAGLARARSAIGSSSNGYVWTRLGLDAFGQSIASTSLDATPGYFALVVGPPLVGPFRVGFSVIKTAAWSPGSIDQALKSPSLDYAASSGFSTLMPSVAVGWSLSPSLRVGFATGIAYTSYSNTSTVSGTASVSGQPAEMLSTVRASGHQFHLIETVGLQWDAGRGFTVGALLRSPGISIERGSLVTYQATFTRSGAPPIPVSASFRDDSGAFQYKLPLEASAGLAYRFGRAQVELDVRYHHSPGNYALYRSDKQVQLATSNPDGSTTPGTQPFPTLEYSGRGVVDLAAGGTYRATEALTLHVGAFNSMSPISDANVSTFRKANLFGATAGAALTGEHFSVSLGAACQFGHSDPVPLPELIAAESALQILSVTVLYALAYEF